jgi:nanoRNase/pAp phosphatase (c-di-AMP/oligoRNAs hydrolase)
MAFLINQQIFKTIETSENILITFSRDYNGDNLSSAIALYLFLKKLNKKVEIVCDDFKLKNSYIFLPQIKEVKSKLENLRNFIISLNISKTKVNEISYDVKGSELEFVISPKDGFFEESDITSKSSGFKYDLIFTLGTTDLEKLANVYDRDTEFFYKTPIINIDNNAENENYGQINLIKLTASSTSEILFEMMSENNSNLIDEEIATALLSGIISTTRNFKTNNVAPTTLHIASKLISAGAKRAEIVQNLYQARSLATLKLWGRILAKLKNDPEHKLTWSVVEKKDFEETGASEENLADVVEELISNSFEVETVLILFEEKTSDNDENNIDIIQNQIKNIKGLVVSLKNINSFSLVKNLPEAHGNDMQASFRLKVLTLKEAEEKALNEIKEKLEAIHSHK